VKRTRRRRASYAAVRVAYLLAAKVGKTERRTEAMDMYVGGAGVTIHANSGEQAFTRLAHGVLAANVA
jgi:hypothetical protein